MNTKHFYPDCMVLIVPGFQDNQIKESETMMFSNIGSKPEIMSVSVNLTVNNSPGTFSLTISDTANKYLAQEDPVVEIENLYGYSEGKTKSVLKGVANANFSGANYYEFKNYDDWLSFDHISLKDKNGIYPVYYRRDINQTIVERWAFNSEGGVIWIMPTGTTDPFIGVSNGNIISFKVLKTKNSSGEMQKFTVIKHKNEDFITKYRDKEEQGEDTKLFLRGRCRISPMDRIVIFLSKRFENEESESTSNSNDGRKLMRVFTGFINTVQQGYSENNNTIEIQGEDVTKMMRLSVVNVNPSLSSNKDVAPDRSAEDDITLYTDILRSLTPPEIIKYFTVGGNFKSAGRNINIKGTGYWEIAPDTDGNKKTQYDIEISVDNQGNKIIKRIDDKDEASRLKKMRNSNKNYSLASFKSILGDLFTPSKVHIIDPFIHSSKIEGFRSYEMAFKDGNYRLFQNDFQVKRDIAYKVAEDSAFTFYADRNGEVWFCPPRFNNTHIITAENPEIYIVRTEDIVSYGFIEDDSKIYSSITVNTEPDWEFSDGEINELVPYTATVRDENIILQYGQRIFTYSNPLINTKGTFIDNSGKVNNDMFSKNHQVLQMYAKNLFKKMLAENNTGQLTIVGRPEISPGYPIYVPIRNMIYYVESVDHSFTFGSRFETTLHLSYGRKPWETVPEILYISASDLMGSSINHKSASKNTEKSKKSSLNDSSKSDKSTDPLSKVGLKSSTFTAKDTLDKTNFMSSMNTVNGSDRSDISDSSNKHTKFEQK